MGILLALLAVSVHAQTGRIQVSVSDPTGAPLDAQIRVTKAEADTPEFEARASGLFLSEPLPAGRYRLTVKASGFRAQVLECLVKPGTTTEIPPVKMQLHGCDSPGVNCHFLGGQPKRNTWDESLRADCLVDLDRGKTKKCANEKTADLRVELQDQKLFFVAAGGARFSGVNPGAQTCQTAVYTEDRIRVDQLGSGFDMCIKTNRGKFVTIYFIHEVPKGESTIPVRFAVRR